LGREPRSEAMVSVRIWSISPYSAGTPDAITPSTQEGRSMSMCQVGRPAGHASDDFVPLFPDGRDPADGPGRTNGRQHHGPGERRHRPRPPRETIGLVNPLGTRAMSPPIPSMYLVKVSSRSDWCSTRETSPWATPSWPASTTWVSDRAGRSKASASPYAARRRSARSARWPRPPGSRARRCGRGLWGRRCPTLRQGCSSWLLLGLGHIFRAIFRLDNPNRRRQSSGARRPPPLGDHRPTDQK
jgi:hypothetical protein